MLSSRLLAPNWTNTIRLDEIRTIKLTFLLGRISAIRYKPFRFVSCCARRYIRGVVKLRKRIRTIPLIPRLLRFEFLSLDSFGSPRTSCSGRDLLLWPGLRTNGVLAEGLAETRRIEAVGAEVTAECSQRPEGCVSVSNVLCRFSKRQEERSGRAVLRNQGQAKTGESRTRYFDIVVSPLRILQPRQNKFRESRGARRDIDCILVIE